jgi:hypothetical protein
VGRAHGGLNAASLFRQGLANVLLRDARTAGFQRHHRNREMLCQSTLYLSTNSDKPSPSDTASPVRPDKIPIVAGAKAGRPVLPGDQVEEQRRTKK